MDDHADLLAERLEALERRVCLLEHPSETPHTTTFHPPDSARNSEQLPSVLTGSVFSVLGKAMIGIAGAYLLRSVAESNSLPKLLIAALAIAYAMLWLICAVRAHGSLSTITYTGTSAFILAPMLWELTLNFQVLTAVECAAVLSTFAGAAFALAWKRNLTSIFWIANVTATSVAFALSIATHQTMPFIAALLLMTLLAESAAFFDHGHNVRYLVATVADLAVGAQFYIYASPQNGRMDYPVLGTVALLVPSLLLFLMGGSSTVINATFFERKIATFETLQATVAFLLLAGTVLACAPRHGAIVLGAICLLLSAVSYATVIGFFSRFPDRRNEQVFGAWSAALLMAGGMLCLPTPAVAPSLAVAAMGAELLDVYLNRPLLRFHGEAFLIASAVASGLLMYVFQTLLGTLPAAPAWSAYAVTVSAVFCYMARKPDQEATFKSKILDFISALLAVSATAAFLVEGLVALATLRVTPATYHIAFIRTLTICATVLALAYFGAHWRRMELTRIGYAALALVTVKLILEDLRLGHLEYTAASIFLFAITLILVPRVRIPERHIEI